MNRSQLASVSGAMACLAVLLASPAAGQVTSLQSVDSGGVQGPKDAFDPWISVDGRYVAFMSYNDLDSGILPDLGTHSDVYVRDRQTGVTERLSVNSSEVTGNSYSYNASLSADLRYAAFLSFSTNLVAGDTNGPYPIGLDVFVRDRLNGTTERASVASNGAEGDGESFAPSISADGRYVVFYSLSDNLVAGDTNGAADVFVHDRQTGATERVSVGPLGAEGNGESDSPSVSTDGRYVAFRSAASNLVVGDINGFTDVFVHDRQVGATQLLSIASGGAPGSGDSYAPWVNADGRYVAYWSAASNLVPGDTNGAWDVFLRDRQNGTTERVSLSSGGTQGNGNSNAPMLSGDGRYLVFFSDASDLVPGDTNSHKDVFVRDLQNGTTERVSVNSNGAEGAIESGIYGGSISADGRVVAFDSHAVLAIDDTNFAHDVYARDLDYAPMTSLCDAGSGGVVACPCGNPAAGPGQGCDNSAGTGGAVLSAMGVAYLSTDSLVFTTSGERPMALSIVLQGNALLSSGAIYGQGVRCAGGTLKRLYNQAASGGSITAPDFGAGDQQVSVRSAAKGDLIQPGQSRWYLVYYRDPNVLGGCPATSTFNATQTGQVTWYP